MFIKKYKIKQIVFVPNTILVSMQFFLKFIILKRSYAELFNLVLTWNTSKFM